MRGDPAAAPRVLVTWLGFDPDGHATGARLRAAGLRVALAPKTGHRTAAEMRHLIDGAVAAIVSTDPIDRAVLEAAPRLRVISRVGVGTESIDLAAATEAGVVVTTTPGANRDATADHALALILASLRRVVEHDSSVRRGEWRRAGDLTPWELHSATVGLVGYGSIGQAVARRLGGFDVELLICDPAADRTDTSVSLPELLRRSDVVSLHLPLTQDNRHLIGRDELELMRPTSVLVNTSRGGLVDTDAVTRALDDGRLSAVALDVAEQEPLAEGHPLRTHERAVVTPHMSFASVEATDELQRRATDEVVRALTGRPPRCPVNPEAISGAA